MESKLKDALSLSIGSLITVSIYFFLSNVNYLEIYFLNRVLLIFLILISLFLLNVYSKESKIFYSSVPLILLISIFTNIESTFVLLLINWPLLSVIILFLFQNRSVKVEDTSNVIKFKKIYCKLVILKKTNQSD